MNLVLLVWVLAVAVALLLGYEVGKWLFGTNQKLQAKKRAAQTVATKLQEGPQAAAATARRLRGRRHQRLAGTSPGCG